MARPRVVRISLATGVLEIAVPDPIGFIAMKLEAKLRLRPTQTKDSFDIYAYAATKGAPAIAAALANSTADGPRISRQLAQLFGEVDAPGVADVVSYAGSLGDEERALLARAVVDLFDAIREG